MALVSCSGKPEVKYVFYLIGDGMGVNHVMGAQQYNEATGNGPAQINFAQFPVRGFVTTVSATSLVTDSAAGGTALATGQKTYNGAIGMGADTTRVSNITEWAVNAGFGTGIATSVGVNHATPASFMAHTEKRRNYDDIICHYIDSSSVDFVAGAGIIARNPDRNPDWYEARAKENGITVLKGGDAFGDIASVEGRVLCLSAKQQEDLPYAIDRKEDDTSLADFVSAGISYLEARYGEKGFFFMIEGGKIDYSAHGNDAATTFREVTDFARAVEVVLEFQRRHPDETLVVVTADHETGGLMLGAGRYEIRPELLASQKMSESALTNLFQETFFPEGKPYRTPSWEQVKQFFSDNLGLWSQVDVSEKSEKMLFNTYEMTFGKGGNRSLSEKNLYSENAKMVSDAITCLDLAAGYSWSHNSHSGSPVGLYVTGRGCEAFTCVKDNTEIAPVIAGLAGYKR